MAHDLIALYIIISLIIIVIYGSLKVTNATLQILIVIIKNNIFRSVFKTQIITIKNQVKAIKNNHIKSFINQIHEKLSNDKYSLCITGKHKCEASKELMRINIQLYELLLDRVFRETVKEVMVKSLEEFEYLDYDNEKYTEILIERFKNTIQVKLKVLWPNIEYAFKISFEERMKYIKKNKNENFMLNPDYIATLQIAVQVKLIYIKAKDLINRMEIDFKKNPLSIIKYALELKNGWE